MTKDHDSAVKTLYKIVDGEVEAVEFKVTEHLIIYNNRICGC